MTFEPRPHLAFLIGFHVALRYLDSSPQNPSVIVGHQYPLIWESALKEHSPD